MTGQDMRMIRRLLGMTQKTFGSELGIPNPQVQVASMEAGTRPVSRRLAKAIELMVDNHKRQQMMDKAGLKETA